MSELRPIDANLAKRMLIHDYAYAAATIMHEIPTIDTRTLPIVKELEEKIAWYKQVEREGRLIVLPCKVGDKVKVCAETWGNIWNYKAYYHNGQEYLIGEIIAVVKTKKQILMKIRVEHNVSWKRPTKRYPISALGKSVFVVKRENESSSKESDKLYEND